MMQLFVYLISAFLLVVGAFVIFRIFVRRDYQQKGQFVGGALLVAGSAMLWPSWYALGWVVLYAVVAHTMVLTEEEHLGKVYSEEYLRYCKRTPRYIGLPKSRPQERN
jgi:quinol-cytochrome oxidoreductase complex cytochrome b subunit